MGLVLESHVTSVLFGRFAEAHAFRHVEEKWNLLMSVSGNVGPPSYKLVYKPQ